MNLLRLLIFGTVGVVMGLITLTMVACQAVVLSAVLALSRFAHLLGRRAPPERRPPSSASVHGRVIEGEFSVDRSGRAGRREDE